MSQRTRNIWAGTVATVCIALALILVPALLQGYDARHAAPGKFVVHEWGTFTSFNGSNGVSLEFRPLVTNDLPRFVMTPGTQPGSPCAINIFLKDQYVARQRMETPVTYFYTDVPRKVNVRVDFPKGLLTEWFPVVKQFDTGKDENKRAVVGGTFLDWGTVQLTSPDQFANVRVRGPKNEPLPASLPRVNEKDHYGRARETDSAIVETVDVNGGSHFEKFLFYRGVGNFDLPIRMVSLGNERFEVTNSGEVASGALLLVRIDQGRVRFMRMDPIKPQAVIETSLPTTESTVDQLAEAMVRELTAAGLYEKESLAMVNTWRSSWFGENGTRLLYLVPEKTTDTLLPLTIDPAPDERVRVLVGRLETITPEDCEKLVQNLVGSGAEGKPTPKAIKEELKSLGRFAEPAVQYAISQTNDSSVRGRLEAVLADFRKSR